MGGGIPFWSASAAARDDIVGGSEETVHGTAEGLRGDVGKARLLAAGCVHSPGRGAWVSGSAGGLLSKTYTIESGHVDKAATTLWFVLHGDRTQELTPDPGEFRGTAWFCLDEPVDWAAAHFDPHMARFVEKLSAALVTSASAL